MGQNVIKLKGEIGKSTVGYSSTPLSATDKPTTQNISKELNTINQ